MQRIIAILVLFSLSCTYMGGRRVIGNGVFASKTHNVEGFNNITVSGPIDVFISQGNDFTVKVEGDENLLEYIEIEEHGDELEISPKDRYNLRPKAGIKVFVIAPVFDQLSVAGSGSIKSQTKITNSNKMQVNVGGSGDVLIEADAPTITTNIGGSGSISVKGNTRNFIVHIGGSGEINAFDLLSETTNVNIAGSGDAEISASKELHIKIAGSGDVAYKGNPVVKQNTVGSGNIRKVQ
ncbi:MAG: head GIN domain-containing protein [Chitinophagaceae bacterium]